MPIGMLVVMPALTERERTHASDAWFGGELTATNAPDGLLVHTTGSSAYGWYVYEIWRSREELERFMEEAIAATTNLLGWPVEPQFFEVDDLFVSR